MENRVYQRSDLLHGAEDSQDNYRQPEQQDENGSSLCVRSYTKRSTVCVSYLGAAGAACARDNSSCWEQDLLSPKWVYYKNLTAVFSGDGDEVVDEDKCNNWSDV